METNVQLVLLQVLKEKKASYSSPVTSNFLSKELNLTPSYVREQMSALHRKGLVRVRRGPKGGYYVEERKKLIVELDGNVSEYPYGSFSEVYQSLMREMAEQQKVISGISINGVRISPDYLDSMALDEVSAAVITTTTVDSLIIDTIKTAIEYLPKLQSACLSVAENIHAGRDGESFRLLNEMSDGLEWMEQVSHGLANVSSDEIVRRAFEAWHDRYVEQLLVLVSAMERRDIISIADICEYELIPLFAECEEIMTKA